MQTAEELERIQELKKAAEPERDISEQWEYKSLTLVGDLYVALNHAGKRGWEVIMIAEQPDGSISALVKRRPSRITLATELPSRVSLAL